jgi:hypothetical protein
MTEEKQAGEDYSVVSLHWCLHLKLLYLLVISVVVALWQLK